MRRIPRIVLLLSTGIAALSPVFLRSEAFAASTKTFSTDTEFSFFQKDNVVVTGSGEAASLSMENRWTEFVIPGPSARYYAAAAASPSAGAVFLHGGRNSANPSGLNDFWLYNPSEIKWTQRSAAASPSARYAHTAVAVGAAAFLVFGGLDGESFLGDTHIYDVSANSWQRLFLSVEPSSRAHCASAFDAARNRVYIFGGQSEGGVTRGDLWYYDVASQQWNYVAQVSTPTARSGSAMVYDPSADTLILFGGANSAGAKLDDTWHYSYGASSWTLMPPPATRPVSRQYHGFVMDDFLNRAVLFGGQIDGAPYVSGEIWAYSLRANQWGSAAPLDASPAARYGAAMAYCGYNLLFGGAGPESPGNDTWKYVTASSGSFVSNVISEFTPTGIRWLTLDISPPPAPSGTVRDFQISASSDNVSWSDFAGPGGDPNQFFIYNGSPMDIDLSYWRNKPNIKIKCRMSSERPPVSPLVDEIILVYNRPPYAPVSSYPVSGKRVGSTSPYFTWSRPDDPDGDTVDVYEMQVSSLSGFSPVFFSSAGIAGAGFSAVTSTPGAVLVEGDWYWRVRASDGRHYGLWSTAYDFRVDTTPPAAVADFSAARGNVNGAIFLSLKVSGDDVTVGNLADAACIVRYSSKPVITEDDWNAATGSKTVVITNMPAGASLNIDITGLADASTYYFNARLRDGALNIGPMSAVSPSAATNRPPLAALSASPTGTVSGDVSVSWTSSDPENDDYTHRIFASSDGASSFATELTAAALPKSTTYYILNTRRLRNGVYSLMVAVVDEPFGLSSATVSGEFAVSNANESPTVTVSSPSAGDVLAGIRRFQWNIGDANLADKHSSEIRISSDGGTSYGRVWASSTDYFDLDTRLLPNGIFYAARIVVTDDGDPPLSGASPPRSFVINNSNLPPGAFVLLSPADKKYRSALGFYFEWEPAVDPNPEDAVTYRLEYSTSSNFSAAVVADGIVASSLPVSASDIIPETTYYWRVSARDPFGATTFCGRPFEFYALNRFGAATDDNRLTVRARKGLPAEAFVFVAGRDPSTVEAAIAANLKTVGDPFTKALAEAEIYKIGFFDANMNELTPAGEVELEVTYDYSSATDGSGHSSAGGAFAAPRRARLSDSILSVEKNARIALLDETSSKWILARDLPSVGDGRLRSVLYGVGYISVMAALDPAYGLMSPANYPNPFDPVKEKTKIVYTLSVETDVEINIYTLTGDLVIRRKYSAGSNGAMSQSSGYVNEILWDGKNDEGMIVASGVYILEITAGGQKRRKKLAVIKR